MGVETTNHLLFCCEMTREFWRMILIWWDLPVVYFMCFEEWRRWLENIQIRKEVKNYIEATCYVTWWTLWNYRNKRIFTTERCCKSYLFEEVITQAYMCCNNRGKRNLARIDWMRCPKYVCS